MWALCVLFLLWQIEHETRSTYNHEQEMSSMPGNELSTTWKSTGGDHTVVTKRGVGESDLDMLSRHNAACSYDLTHGFPILP